MDSVPRAPSKTSHGLACFSRLYEKERGFHGCEQARPDGLLSLFLRTSCARTAQPSMPADCLCGNTHVGPPQRRLLPLVFSAEKTATSKRAPYHSGSLRSAAPRACEARRKRNRRKMGQARLHPLSPVLFRYRLPRQNSSYLPTQTQVLWYFLDARKYRPPRPPSSPYSFSTMFVSVCKPTANPCELSSR